MQTAPRETRSYPYDPSLSSWRDVPCAYVDCGLPYREHDIVGGGAYAYCPAFSPLRSTTLRQFDSPRREARYLCGCPCSLNPSQPDPDRICSICRDKAEKKAARDARSAARKLARERGEVVSRATAPTMYADRAPSIYADLPLVVDVIGVDDAGEFGAALCPHCGAEGRYTTSFKVRGSAETYGAMRGCFSQFPKHPVVERIAAFVERMETNTRKGWAPSGFDRRIQAALDTFRASDYADPDVLLGEFKAVDQARDAWRRGSRRTYR